jgi:hypothetical protein
MKRNWTIPLLLLVALLSTAFAQQTPPILPVEPHQLLGILPAAPADWKIIRSDAETTLGEWLETRATRVFQAPPAPVEAGTAVSASKAPRGEIEINVVDTAGFGPALAPFVGFKTSKSDGLEKKVLGSLPAIIVTSTDGKQLAQVLVASRYLVELTFTHLTNARVEDLLRGFRFDTLPQKGQTLTNRPREFQLTHIDELEPTNNRSYSVTTTSTKRLDDFLKTLPPAPPDPTHSATSGAEPAATSTGVK